jgi:hypothetical protein
MSEPCEAREHFGVLITGKDSPFAGSHHLAEDVWLPAGTGRAQHRGRHRAVLGLQPDLDRTRAAASTGTSAT